MKICAIGAHPDDIEIGCGGALASHAQKGDEVRLIVLSSGEKGGAEAGVRLAEAKSSAEILGAKSFDSLSFRDTEITYSHQAVEALENLIKQYQPDRVYIPYFREIHQDHENTNRIALAACRNVSQILMYEGPSTFNTFQVTFWVDISKTIGLKEQSILNHKSQGEKEIVKVEAIKGMNRFRGFQARIDYAEGFSVFRFVEV